jgi:single-stranded DNA-binding protein
MSSSEIYLSGPLFAEPEIGRTADNQPSVKILILADLIRKKGLGLYQIETTVLPISCYGEPATQAARLRHGDRVVVEGHLFGTTFRPPDGSVRRGIQFRADELLLHRRGPSPLVIPEPSEKPFPTLPAHTP